MTLAIWVCDSWPLNDGIAPAPCVTRRKARERAGLAWSRFGPTVPVEPASLRVWQPVQPAERNTFLPATGSPCLYEAGTFVVFAFGSVPMTVTGSGAAVFSPGFELSQPASRNPATTRSAEIASTRVGRARRTARVYTAPPPAPPGKRTR